MANETTENSEVVADTVKVWAKDIIVRCILDEDTNGMRDEVSAIFEHVSKVRVMFDNAAREQGNPTIRKQRSDTGKTDTLTADEKAEKAKAKALELIG